MTREGHNQTLGTQHYADTQSQETGQLALSDAMIHEVALRWVQLRLWNLTHVAAGYTMSRGPQFSAQYKVVNV